MSTLYELTNEFQELYEMATEDGDEQAFIDSLESLQYELKDKAAGYAHVIHQIQMEVDECDRVIESFKSKKETRTNNIKRMKEALMRAMDIAEIKELPAGEYKMKIAKNGGLQPLKIDGDIPDNYTKVIVQPDNDLIRKALSEGKNLDFAHLEERGRHLSIK